MPFGPSSFRTLGHGVGQRLRISNSGENGRDIDDATVFADPLDRLLGQKEWSLDVHTEQLIEGLLIGTLETSCRRNSCIVDQNIEPIISGPLAELPVGLVEQGADSRDGGKFSLDNEGVAAVLDNRGDSFLSW
jgi:hypothetical protein